MNCHISLILLILSVVLIPEVRAQDRIPAEAVVKWNQSVLEIAEKEDGFLTLKGLRTTVMMHVAMHDALNSVDPEYAMYSSGASVSGANGFVALNQAAFRVASDQYPDKNEAFRELRDAFISSTKQTEGYAAGMQLGDAVADRIMQTREADGWNTEADYQWHPMAPGVYAEFNEHSGTPEGFIFGAGWGEAKPFALDSNDLFVSPPPPDIHSPAYTRAFDEVKKLGAFQSEARTDDQTHLALWWKDFVENSHNRLARHLVSKEQLGLAEAARLFALLNMSVYDAYVSSFYNKFLYNHWRPYTAIRWAANDENPDTKEDASWTNTHQHTYAFPSYPSAHGTACSAANTVLASVFGDAYSYTMKTKEVDKAGPFSGKIKMDPPVRSFLNFHEAALECAFSRVYLGIHFSYDSLEGVDLGRNVGRHVVEKYLTAR